MDARLNGQGAANWEVYLVAFEGNAKLARIDEESFDLIFVPMVRWLVDRFTGSDGSLHSVEGIGVIAEELNTGGAVFGGDCAKVCPWSPSRRLGEEGEHFV